MNIKEKVSTWIINHARLLDQAKFNYLYGDGSKETYINEIKKYQTPSGGFANSMEPDTMNPNPSAIQTWTAIHYIMDLDLDKDHDIVKGIVKYLEDEMKHSELFMTVIPSNNDYPHAIWWHYQEKSCIWGYNPSVALWAYLYRINQNQLAKNRLINAFSDFINEPKLEMHELKCFIDAYEWLYDQKQDFSEFNLFEKRLHDTLKLLLKDFQLRDKSVYGPSPLTFCDDKQTHIYRFLKPYIDEQVMDEVQYLNDHDIWQVNFAWGQFEEQFSIVKPYWEAINAMHIYEFL